MHPFALFVIVMVTLFIMVLVDVELYYAGVYEKVKNWFKKRSSNQD